jgi:hypothetical protein
VGSAEIDDEIELRGGVDGKIARVSSAKDMIDVASRLDGNAQAHWARRR